MGSDLAGFRATKSPANTKKRRDIRFITIHPYIVMPSVNDVIYLSYLQQNGLLAQQNGLLTDQPDDAVLI
jgi:hypothetical protein